MEILKVTILGNTKKVCSMRVDSRVDNFRVRIRIRIGVMKIVDLWVPNSKCVYWGGTNGINGIMENWPTKISIYAMKFYAI